MKRDYKMLVMGKAAGDKDRDRDTAGTVFSVSPRKGFSSATADARDLDINAIDVPGGRTCVGHGVTIKYASGKLREVRFIW